MALLSSELSQNGLKSKNPHLITNFQYIQLYNRYEKTILSEESLSETPQQLLQSTISQLESLQFEVQLALQGGTLLEDVQQGFESTQVQWNLNNLMDKIQQEIGLYKEFVENRADLNLDFILNEDLEVNESESFELNRNSSIINDTDELDFGSESGGIMSPQFSQSLYSEATSQFLRRPNTIPLPSMIDDIDFEELKESTLNFQGELIRWVPLLKISDQLFSQKSRETIGYPTLISINTVIAIGTTRGLALIFDFQQKLVNVLGSPALALEHGEVTSLTISSDGYYLSVGYAKGLILIYSLKTYQRLHNIFPVNSQSRKSSHVLGSTITHLSFLPSNKPRLISSDENGGVYLHKFTNRMVMNSKETFNIFDAKDISNFINPQENAYPPLLLVVKALPLGPSKHVTDSKSLVAIITPQLLTIICVKPKPTVLVKLFRKHLESGVQAQRGKQYSQFLESGISGALAWFPCTQDSSTNQDCHPTLAFSFGKYVCVLQITPTANLNSPKKKTKPKASLEVVKIGDLCSTNPVVSLKWINRRNLIIVDSLERCSVIDLNDVDRTYYLGNLSSFSPLGRDPYTLYHLTPSDGIKSDNTKHHLLYSQSISSYKSKLFILGQRQLYLGLPLTWSDHVFSLVSSGRTVDSILLGLEYLRNGSPYYFSNLPTSHLERKEKVRPVMIELMVALLNHLFQRCLSMVDDLSQINDPLVVHPLIIEAKEIVNSIIEASIEVEAFEWLLNDVYTMFVDNDYSLVFYEALEPYLLNDVNSSLSENLSPALVQDLFRTYSQSPHLLMRLDSLLLKLNPVLLDIDYTISLCRNHNMTRCLMYIWSCALNDFISPIGELFLNWDIHEEPNWSGELTPVFLGIPTPKSPTPPNDTATSSKNRLFQYLTESLSGWQYPTKIPHSSEASILAWNQLVQWTINKGLSNWPTSHQQKFITVPQLIISGNRVEFEDLVYPYLTFLIKLDISKTIKYLELLDSRGLLVHSQIKNVDQTEEVNQLSLQSIAQSIFELLDSEFEFTSEEVCQLRCFLVRMWTLERITMTEEFIKSTFHTLANPELSPDFLLAERQDACRNLIREQVILQIPELNSILDKCHFLLILKQRLLANGDYPSVVKCYLKDNSLLPDLIILTDEIFKHKSISITKNQKLEIQNSLLQNILIFIDWNVAKAVQLIDQWFDKDHHPVIKHLEIEESYKYYYLQEYFDSWFTKNSQDLLDQLIVLKAQKDPQTLLPLLTKLSDDDVRFNMEHCLQLSRQYHITDVTVWILERGGNPSGAMEEILEVLQTRSKKLLESLKALTSKDPENGSIYDINHHINYQLIRLQSGVKIAIQLCDRVHLKQKQHNMATVQSRRNSAFGKLEFSNDAEELYFKTLNFIVETFKLVLGTFASASNSEENANSSVDRFDRSKSTHDIRQVTVGAFKSLVQILFNSILHPTTSLTVVAPGRSIISLPRILVHIMSSLNSTSPSTPVLGELRDVIYGVLEACRSELRWLSVTLQLLHRDMFTLVQEDYSLRTKGLRGYGVRCTICKDRLINISNGNVIIFRCGHLAHSECLIQKLDTNQETWICTKCNPTD